MPQYDNVDIQQKIFSVTTYEKKERMVADEATSRQLDAQSRSTIWLECLQSSAKRVKKLYPDIELEFKLRYDPEEAEDEQRETNTDRIISV